MSRKSSTLARLRQLYEMVEKLNALQVHAASSSLMKAEQGLLQIAQSNRRQAAAARAGVADGSLMELISIERTAGSVIRQREMLAQLAQQRRSSFDSAVDLHRVGQLEVRKIGRLLEQEKSLADARADRSAQQQSDDRFLSRAAWMLGREDILTRQ